MIKSKEKIIVTLEEYEAILALKFIVRAWAIAEPNWNKQPTKIMLEIECPEWVIMRNKLLVRMLCQK